jgi:uncharacterized paraquat-inducible protein A
MTEQVVSLIPVSDLTTIRIGCKNCKTVFEFDASQLFAPFEYGQCPRCHAQLDSHTAPVLPSLPTILSRLKDAQAMTVEFVVHKKVQG